MNCRERSIWVALGVGGLLILVALNGHATHFYNPSLSELVKGSDFVFVGEVLKVRRTFLGYRRTTLKMLEPIKGDAPREVEVRYGESWVQSQANVPVLRERERYLFFVVYSEHAFLLAGITGAVYYRIDSNGEVLCGQERLPLKECTEKARKLRDALPAQGA